MAAIVDLNTAVWTEQAAPAAQGPRSRLACRMLALTEAAGGQHVGVVLEELPTGMHSSLHHYHTLEEEHLLMLSGEAVLVWGDREHALRRDHYVCFPAGEPRAHHLENRSGAPCTYLLIGERKPDDVVVYPELNKALIKPLNRRLVDL